MSQLKNIVFSEYPKEPERFLEVDICVVHDWDGFDKLIQFLKNEYAITVLKQIDGVCTRRWKLLSTDIIFELHHDEYGNTLIALDEGSEILVREIGLDLQERFKDFS